MFSSSYSQSPNFPQEVWSQMQQHKPNWDGRVVLQSLIKLLVLPSWNAWCLFSAYTDAEVTSFAVVFELSILELCFFFYTKCVFLNRWHNSVHFRFIIQVNNSPQKVIISWFYHMWVFFISVKWIFLYFYLGVTKQTKKLNFMLETTGGSVIPETLNELFKHIFSYHMFIYLYLEINL